MQSSTRQKARTGTGQAGTCDGCGARITWIKIRRQDGSIGKTMPCDPAMLPGDEKRTLVVLDEDGFGHVVVKAGPGYVGRESHFATCPERDRFKRR